MKIAITGANGFIGSHLINKLKQLKKDKIYIFKRKKYSLFNAKSLKKFVKNKDIIIHLAGKIAASKPLILYRTNFWGTINLLEAISTYGKKNTQFIFASSFAVYQPILKENLLGEKKTKTQPRNHYGMSKLLAEKIISFYCQNKHLRVRILRLSNVYGPKAGNSVVTTFIKNIQQDKPIIINGTGEQSRDFVYIDDVVDALIKTIKYQRKDFLLVNICSGKKIKIISLIKEIEKILDKKAVIKFNYRHQEKGYWIGNPHQAWQKIKFKARINLETGLRKTANWFIKNS